VTGSFQGTADFDPGPGTYDLTSAGSQDFFVAKYSSAGALLWARRMGGAGNDGGGPVAVGAGGDVYIAGNFANTATFGTTSLVSSGANDVFVLKLDSAGNVVWVRGMGGPSNDMQGALALAPDGAVCATGRFSGTATFGTTSLVSSGAYDIFVLRLDSVGNVSWAKRMGGTGDDIGSGIAFGADGSIYSAGRFSGTAAFGSINLISAGSFDIFVAKVDSAGNVSWARSMGGISDDGSSSVAVGADGSVYAAGYFFAAATFGATTLTSAGAGDVFVMRLDSAGNIAWSRRLGGASDETAYKIAVGGDGSIYTTGYFFETTDFDPGPATFALASRGWFRCVRFQPEPLG